jgi:hypothetical protein
MTMSFSTTRPAPQLPFRIVVLGEFVGFGGQASTILHRVDGSSFDEVLATVSSRLDLPLAPRVPVGLPLGLPLVPPVTLRFDSFRSLRPEGFIRQAPGGAGLMVVRQVLAQLKSRKISADEAIGAIRGADLPDAVLQRIVTALNSGSAPPREALAPSPAPPTPPGPENRPVSADPLGGLLSMVDVPGSSAESTAPGPERAGSPSPADPAASAMSAIIRSIAGGKSTAGVPTAGISAALEVVDDELGGITGEILGHPLFRRFEAAWRGLRFLVSRVDFREGVTIEIRNARPAMLADTVRQLAYDKTTGVLGEPPVSLVIGSFLLEGFEADPEILIETARAAATLEAPVVVAVEEASAGELASAPDWQAFRNEPEAAWLALATNPFLLRLPYGAGREPVRDFNYEEPDGSFLPGSPALAVAAIAARSQARTGWPTTLEGREATIDDLPIHAVPGGQIATERHVRPDEVSRLEDRGIITLAGVLDRDLIFLPHAVAVGLNTSLPRRLAESRLVALLKRALADLPGSAGIPEIEILFRNQLKALGQNDPALSITTAPAAGWGDDVRTMTIRWKPSPPVLASPEPIELNFLV